MTRCPGPTPSCGRALSLEPSPAEGPQAAEAEVAEISPDKNPEDSQEGLKKEFSELVSEVGSMITLAKDHSIDTTAPRRLIDKAVAMEKHTVEVGDKGMTILGPTLG